MTESSSPDDNSAKLVAESQNSTDRELELTSTDGTIIKHLNGSQGFDNDLQSDDELIDKAKQLHSTASNESSESLDLVPQKSGDSCLPALASGEKLAVGSGSAKYSKTGGVYSCKSCTYASDKKALLLKHVRTAHGMALASGLSPLSEHQSAIHHNHNTALTTTDESDDNEFHQLSSAPQDRYCTNCDIQFNSFKTYKVCLRSDIDTHHR